jgi:hypothetical protein
MGKDLILWLFGDNKWGCESKDLILYTGDSQSIEGGSLVIQSGMGKNSMEGDGLGTNCKGKGVTGTTRDREKA